MERFSGTIGSKEQIRQLLRDAVCMLCKNTVDHNINMKIEALIGITIDNDSNVLLININELMEKSSDSINAGKMPPHTESRSHSKSVSYHSGERMYDSDFIGQYQKPVTTDSAIVYEHMPRTQKVNFATSKVLIKTEPFSNASSDCSDSRSQLADCKQNYNDFDTSSANPEECASTTIRSLTTYQQSGLSGQSNTNSETAIDVEDDVGVDWGQHCEDGSGVDQFDTQYDCTDDYTNSEYDQSGDAMLQSDQSYYHAPQKQTGFGRRKFNAARLVKRKPAKKPIYPATGDGQQGDDEVSHVTVFTCSVCGAQLTNRRSFLRHKRSHLGIVYRCDACGKILSRCDKLTAHRKKCAAFLYQESQDCGDINNQSGWI